MKSVLEYLENSAKRYPEKTAVRDLQEAYSYRQLEEYGRRIGSALAADLSGSGCPDRQRMRRPVIVYMEKSARALASFMGTVYAGCFYTFISPSQPVSRIRRILDVLGADRAIFSGGPQDLEKLREAGFRGSVLEFEEALRCREDAELLERIRGQAQDIDPLYCNFTSGSTGIPKGVLIAHRSVIDFMNYFPDMFHITEEDVIGNQAPFDFDVSVKDIYSTLKTGASLVILPKRLFSVPKELLDCLCEYKVTTLIWAVSALCIITQLRGFSYRVPESVNKVLFSGEVMPVSHLNQWRTYLPDAEFVNLYGPTEITCNCTYYRVEREFGADEKLPAGKPFPNEKVFLLDIGMYTSEKEPGEAVQKPEYREITQPGRIGEICVSGTAVGLGYYNDPVRTAEVFVQNPLNSSYEERIYRTGDLGFFNEDGDLCFAGRKDFQIKHMGHRIELEEIERIIGGYDGVDRVCCLFDEEKDRIIAWYVGTPAGRDLKKKMRGTESVYLIPQMFFQIDSLPVTENGKIDRKKLMAEYKESRGRKNG